MYYNFRDPYYAPSRGYRGLPKSHYRAYKDQLREDFKKRCGYTFCSDGWFGGPSCFHIDHLKSKKYYKDLIHTYENLVYCCASVNIAKSDDHSCEYLDPCDIDFNKDFARNCFGRIIIRSDAPHQKIAQHMYERMKLYLTKYALIWWLDRLTILVNEARQLKKQYPDNIDLKNALDEVIEAYYDMTEFSRVS